MAAVSTLAVSEDNLLCSGGRHDATEGRALWQRGLARLVEMSEEELATQDIARLNLFCATGLPGSEGIDFDACIAKLDDWSDYIGRNIERWWPDFLAAPQEGEDSPGKFRMACVATLLQQQLGVHYNVAFTEGDYDGRDSRNLFLHGVLSGRGGTCVCLPVLYIAIGRRLGYPLFLVRSKEHFFARWEEPGGERFNVECAVRGFAFRSDEHYRTWREPITDFEVANGIFLRNLTRREEVAQFLDERGNCLRDHLRLGEALEAFYHAHRMVPNDPCLTGNWVVTSVMHGVLHEAMLRADRDRADMISITDMCYPEPRDPCEAWAIPHARETFARIARIHENHAPTSQPKWQRKPRRGEPNYHKR
jgi:hypothetical protein